MVNAERRNYTTSGSSYNSDLFLSIIMSGVFAFLSSGSALTDGSQRMVMCLDGSPASIHINSPTSNRKTKKTPTGIRILRPELLKPSLSLTIRRQPPFESREAS